MIALIADGLCAEVVLVLILETQTTDVFLPEEQVLQPLGDQLVPPLEPVVGGIVEAGFFDIDIEGKVFLGDVWRAELHAFFFIGYDAHILVHDGLVRHGVLNEIPGDEVPDAGLFGDFHQGFLCVIGKDDVTNDIVPVVMPRSGFLHRLLTCTFP